MANVTRSSFVKAMVKDNFDYAIESYDRVPIVFDQVFDVETSDSAYEQYTSAIGPGTLTIVAEGASIPEVSAAEGYTAYCANRKRAEVLPITNEAIDDNQKIKNMLKAWASGLGELYANTQDESHADLFNYGGYTAGHDAFDNSIPGVLTPSYGKLIYDAKPFLALSGNNHPAKDGNTYYNSIGTLPLSGKNLETLIKLIKITNAKNEAGVKVTIMPDVLLVAAGSSNAFVAKRLLESMADESAIQSGITNVWKGALRLIEWRMLSDEDAFFVGCAKKGLKSLNRLSLTIDYYDSQGTDSQKVVSRARWGCAVTNFRYWVGANVSTS